MTHRPTTLIFVDDEDAILSSLRSLFRKSDHALKFFPNANDALDFMRGTRVDVIVSDLRMPLLSGVDFLTRAVEINPSNVRIILSGYEDKKIVIDALAQGLAHEYVLKPWDEKELKALIETSLNRLFELRRQHIEKVLGKVCTLPSPPKLHLKLRELLSKSDSSLDAIATEIEKSPSVVAKLLQVANSVFYGGHKSITTISEAAMFIGTEYIINLVTAIEAFHSFSNNDSNRRFEDQIQSLWFTAFNRATVAKNIADHWTEPVDPQMVYVASLLQDIGLAARICVDPDRYGELLDVTSKNELTMYEAEKQLFGVTHDDLSAALLDYWNLSSDVVVAVSNHHRQANGNTIAEILQIAEVLAEKENIMAPRDPKIIEQASFWRERLHL